MRQRSARPAFDVGMTAAHVRALASGTSDAGKHLAKPVHRAFLSAGVIFRYMKLPGENSLRMRRPQARLLPSVRTGHQTKQGSHSMRAVNQLQ